MMLGNKNHAYLGERMQRVVGLDRVQRVAQYLKGLICTPTKLHRLYDSSDMYELQFQSSNTMDVQKNAYHIVLELPMLRLYNALPCHFIVLVDNLIVAVGVR
jgi:hypothetical protein